MRQQWRAWAWAIGTGTLVGAGALAVSGCAAPHQRQTPFMRSFDSVTISTDELRARTLAFAYAFAGTVETAADAIRESTDDATIEETALQWKIQAIPAVQEAAFRSDPLLALLDLWVLAEQMRDFFTTGDGMAAFGPRQDIAVQTSVALVEEAEELAHRVGTDVRFEEAAARVRKFAAEQPIHGRYFMRESIAPALADLTGIRGGGGLQAVGSLDERAQIMLDRMPFYTEYVPKQAVWQVELMISQSGPRLSRELSFAELKNLRKLDEMAAQLEKIGSFADGADELIARERAEILRVIAEELAKQRARITEDASMLIQGEREAIMEQLNDQRETLMRDIVALMASERTTILADIERQRTEAIDAIRAERVAILDEARTIATSTANKAVADARGLVDHAIWRLAQLMVVAGVVVLIVVVVLHRMWGGAGAGGGSGSGGGRPATA